MYIVVYASSPEEFYAWARSENMEPAFDDYYHRTYALDRRGQEFVMATHIFDALLGDAIIVLPGYQVTADQKDLQKVMALLHLEKSIRRTWDSNSL